jgi:outer membrane receptor protein involved in Fe transport
MYLHDIDNASFIVGYDGYRGEQDVNQYARGDSELTGQFDAYINHLDIDAYFTQYQFSPGDNLMLTAGLRYENIVLSSTSYADTAEFSDLAPKLGLTYQLNSDHMIWVGVSEGFYAPDLDDLFDTEEGNQDLKPEQAQNIELGFRGQIGDWQYDTSIYHNDISNYLVTQEFVRTVAGLEEEI